MHSEGYSSCRLCVSVCLSASYLTSRAINRSTDNTTYSASDKGRNMWGFLWNCCIRELRCETRAKKPVCNGRLTLLREGQRLQQSTEDTTRVKNFRRRASATESTCAYMRSCAIQCQETWKYVFRRYLAQKHDVVRSAKLFVMQHDQAQWENLPYIFLSLWRVCIIIAHPLWLVGTNHCKRPYS